MEAIAVVWARDSSGPTRIMSVVKRNEWILDMFKRKFIGLNEWLDMAVGGRQVGCREGRSKDESQILA